MRLLVALRREPLDRPPVWMMRQAGRYLPEYRELRDRHSFAETLDRPDLAAEITLQPLRRFPLDAVIVFADIMTPIQAMGVPVVYEPGPRLTPLTVDLVVGLDEVDPARLTGVTEAIAIVRDRVDPDVAVIGFAGGPATVLAYLLEGGSSQHFPVFRTTMLRAGAEAALSRLAVSMNRYLEAQIRSGAQVVQLFDTWAGLLDRRRFRDLVVPAARAALAGLEVPTIYFAPGASHVLDLLPEIGATAYGVDWRLPLDQAWDRIGTGQAIQGNLDPALLLTDPETVRLATAQVLERAAGRPGHVFNLGHGVFPTTPVENVVAMVGTVVGHVTSSERISIG